jgi:VIT1/CCC1 family predicted Fe2+/Mn2+ transporter
MPKENRIEKAQSAYYSKNVEESKKAHTKHAIERAAELHTKERGKYLGDVVFGALDGIVTTFAVVSGVAGANLSSSVVLILGFANLIGDGISMAMGNYLSTKSELEYIKRERDRETWEVEHVPEGEKEEIRQIFIKKGFKGKDLDRAVDIITSDKTIWIDTMMREELGLTVEDKTPVLSGAATFIAFSIAGFIPLLAFVLAGVIPGLINNSFIVSVALSAFTLFAVGAMKTWVTGKKWYISGVEMLFVGGIAAFAAYLVGFLLKGLGV